MQTYLNMELIQNLNIFNLFTLHTVKLLHPDGVTDITNCNTPVRHLCKIAKTHHDTKNTS